MTYSARQRAAYAARIHAYEDTPLWHLRADEFRRKHGKYCDACWVRGPVDVHHRSYANAFRGKEPDRDLRALCRADHMRVHRLARSGYGLAAATDMIIANYRRRRKPGLLRRLLFLPGGRRTR